MRQSALPADRAGPQPGQICRGRPCWRPAGHTPTHCAPRTGRLARVLSRVPGMDLQPEKRLPQVVALTVVEAQGTRGRLPCWTMSTSRSASFPPPAIKTRSWALTGGAIVPLRSAARMADRGGTRTPTCRFRKAALLPVEPTGPQGNPSPGGAPSATQRACGRGRRRQRRMVRSEKHQVFQFSVCRIGSKRIATITEIG